MIKEQPLCAFTVLKMFFSLLLAQLLLDEIASLVDKDNIIDAADLLL